MELWMMRICSQFVLGAFLVAAVGWSGTATASTVKALVDLSQQRMHVFVEGKKKYTWTVSTGKKGWRTKPGFYTPFAQRKKFYSTKWRMSLPYLTMIGSDGTAIHGTHLTGKLGRPASHGCIRLSVANAAKFYKLVESYGMWSTQVEVRP
jgi:lipoprotein-anchoring transpeptidase ErfK/SrfK